MKKIAWLGAIFVFGLVMTASSGVSATTQDTVGSDGISSCECGSDCQRKGCDCAKGKCKCGDDCKCEKRKSKDCKCGDNCKCGKDCDCKNCGCKNGK